MRLPRIRRLLRMPLPRIRRVDWRRSLSRRRRSRVCALGWRRFRGLTNKRTVLRIVIMIVPVERRVVVNRHMVGIWPFHVMRSRHRRHRDTLRRSNRRRKVRRRLRVRGLGRRSRPTPETWHSGCRGLQRAHMGRRSRS